MLFRSRIGDRPLHRSRSTEQAAAAAYRMAGLDDPATAVQVAELHAPSSAHELMLAESLGLVRNGDPCRSFLDESGPRLNPSGGALGADAVFAGGLVRAAEAALQLSGRADQRQVAEARRAVSHGHSGPFLQANTVFVMERFDA